MWLWAGPGVGGLGAGPGVGGLDGTEGGMLRRVAGFDWTAAVAVETVICFALALEGGGR